MDVIFRTFRVRFLSVHRRSSEFNPDPGTEVDGFAVFLVIGVPEPVSFSDVIDIFKDVDQSAPRFVWTWDDFVRRVPPGPSLMGEAAGKGVGLSAFTMRKYASARKLPAHVASREGHKGGGAFLFNSFDLRWFMETRYVAPGRPRKDSDGPVADEGPDG